MSVSTAYNSPKEAERLSCKAQRCTEEKVITQILFTATEKTEEPTTPTQHSQPLLGGRRASRKKKRAEMVAQVLFTAAAENSEEPMPTPHSQPLLGGRRTSWKKKKKKKLVMFADEVIDDSTIMGQGRRLAKLGRRKAGGDLCSTHFFESDSPTIQCAQQGEWVGTGKTKNSLHTP